VVLIFHKSNIIGRLDQN